MFKAASGYGVFDMNWGGLVWNYTLGKAGCGKKCVCVPLVDCDRV